MRLVRPFAFVVWHEANAIDALPIVEAGTVTFRALWKKSTSSVTSTKGFPSLGPEKAASKTPHFSIVEVIDYSLTAPLVRPETK